MIRIDLPEIGRIRARNVSETRCRHWTLGCETLDRDYADYDAYKDYLTQNGYSGETYNEQLRKFYECYADYWCVQYSDPYWDILINTDVHAASRVRINGVVMNTALWYDLYKVNRNHILFLPEQQRTQIW